LRNGDTTFPNAPMQQHSRCDDRWSVKHTNHTDVALTEQLHAAQMLLHNRK
jgi:hypothetical protein